jgi:serine/threonine protein kinase/formylglycine-generating enzyme required for sulfatase activity
VSNSNDPFRTAPEPVILPVQVADELPVQIGRYRVERLLGEGAFGRVYLARDEQLQRFVAVKVPHPELVTRAEDAEPYLSEARNVAGLDHPNIVTVHDVGGTPEFLLFVVSKYVEGSDLRQRLKGQRPPVLEAAELTAVVAETLHFAHRQGLVHRDIKPGNILLDKNSKPYVADFGVALREENVGRGPRFAGTPAYMSPEQARGEGHRVDGRSDIFSLGIVFYELLTGRRPFSGQTRDEVLEQITTLAARPLRQWDDSIPKELERICLKALAKRAADRYLTAKDMADDLRCYLAESPVPVPLPLPRPDGASGTDTVMEWEPDSDRLRVVPKGLRSFDAHDADFFLELLPGPRDRGGLPESIRFWKTRIEEMNADGTFAVGLIYGPSGCGKSSLVKAGLLPRLANSVMSVYVETTAQETEARLLKGLRRHVPDLAGNLGLVESLAALRRGNFLAPGRKVLIVLDQFEQWLHAKRSDENTELVQALRQCDGGRLQCVVLVRDDFWLAVSRFMQHLEIRVLEGENSRLVDLFDPRHARRVLTAFGRAFGTLSDKELTKEHEAFLDKAIAGLAQDGKVISVRLALFAEMVKGKQWTPATLEEVGGIEGIGVTFLDETFAASTAPPQHRLHQKAAQSVLRALLPKAGTDIKGHMRLQEELREASGYASRPRDFEDLLRILDGELRLITPTEPDPVSVENPASVEASARRGCGDATSGLVLDTRLYQLTHDYLVPSLRDWLTRKQKETRRGRAELLLAERAAVWNDRTENRQLPSLLQWFQITGLTAKKNWTPPQRKMMRQATRYHALRGFVLAVLLALIGWGAYEAHGTLKANALRDRLLDANTNEAPTIVQDMAPYRRWLDPLLHDAYAQAENDNDRRKQLHTSLALLPVDVTQVEYLRRRLLEAEPNEVPVIRDFLSPHKDQLLDQLWAVVESPEKGKESQRLRAAAALATFDPESDKWAKAQEAIANDLVSVPAVYLSFWLESLRPVRTELLTPLGAVFRNPKRRDAERTLATDIVADYAADQPHLLADLLMDADENQFAVLYPKFRERGEEGLLVLAREIDRKSPPDAKDEVRERLGKRQANAGVALLRMNQLEKVWPLLKHSTDPRARSYLIHRLYPLGADAGAIIRRLDDEPDITIRRALVLSLGEFDEEKLSLDARNALLLRLQAIYHDDADPGLHAAVEWLLRLWKQETWLEQVNEAWAKDKGQQDKVGRAVLTPGAKPQWYVNGQGQTMVALPGPVEFWMGSPRTEEGRTEDESRHVKLIDRTFAIAAKLVTVAEYRRFAKGHTFEERYAPTPDCPVISVSWFQTAAYCNWLSKQEGLPESEWCYEPFRDPTAMPGLAASSIGLLGSSFGLGPFVATGGAFPGRTDPGYKPGMKLAPNYLKRKGYRLPTEAEMEVATRAGAMTSRYFGETEDLLWKYAWYFKNSRERSWPVGSLKPNEFGLFDALGNAWTWCVDSRKDYPVAKDGAQKEDSEDTLTIELTASRMMRGGSFVDLASDVRSAFRSDIVPTYRDVNIGFRLARTVAP